jgi:small subunit ribosomal protein S21
MGERRTRRQLGIGPPEPKPFRFGADIGIVRDFALIICNGKRNLPNCMSELDLGTNLSRIMKEALRQVWRWDFLAEVRVQEGEPLENALRRFKRKVQQEDIIKEVKRHSYYLKPGEKKRVKAALARKRNRKKARKEAD